MAYPEKPTGNNILPTEVVFAENNTSKIVMSNNELLNGYNNDGDPETALTSRPDANRFNNFWYQVHNTVNWIVGYIEELYTDKLSKAGGSMTGYLNMGTNKVKSSATPTQDDDLVNKAYIDSAVNGAMWISEVKMLAYPSIPKVSEGIEIVPCDGRAISRTTYSELFSLIGTAFGSGNGSTTFNIPDYRGLFLRGWSGNSGRDSNRVYGSIQQSGAPNITGSITVYTSYPGNEADGAFNVELTGGNGESWVFRDGRPKFVFNASRSSSVYQDGLTEVRPINSTVYYVIRIK